MSTEASRPWSVQIELVAGCQLHCSFCGIQAMGWKHGAVHLMTQETAHIIGSNLARLNPKPRIELALRGEPLLNPNAEGCIRAIRRSLPAAQIQLTSNGIALLNEGAHRALGLFKAGLNILALDCYEPYGSKLEMGLRALGLPVIYHPLGDGFSPWNNHGSVGWHVVFMPDIRKSNEQRRVLFNQGGNSSISHLVRPLARTCPSPWRELVIHSDGTVPLCCDDWGEEYVIGNALTQSLYSLWHSDRMQAARRFLRHGWRAFNPCCRCDGPSPGRNRAIPLCDAPSQEDEVIIRKTIALSPNVNQRAAEWWGQNAYIYSNQRAVSADRGA